MSISEKRRELEEKILSKRQEIAFVSDQADLTTEQDKDNNENPDVMEETRNLSEPVNSAVDKADLNALAKAKEELNVLLGELENLKTDQ